MPESFFELSQKDQREALEYARAEAGRPTHLLEKDIWVVWALRTLFEAQVGADLTFKGGTSLSKVYKIIDRFSEDIDLTYDIRKLIPDLIDKGGELPRSRSQADKWTKAVRHRLPESITTNIQPIIETAMAIEGLQAQLEFGGKENDKLLLHYPAFTKGTGYIAPVVTLEFGGRATGEPHEIHAVECDIAEHLPGVAFPTASPQVMSLARTFWEKGDGCPCLLRPGPSPRRAVRPTLARSGCDQPKSALHDGNIGSLSRLSRCPAQITLLHREGQRRPCH